MDDRLQRCAVAGRPRADLWLILMLGIAATTSQTILVREVVVAFVGNELSIGLSFAAWFLGIGLAATAARRVRLDASVLVAALPLVSASAVVVARMLRPLLGVAPGQYASAAALALGTLLVLVPPGAVVGLAFVYLADLWSGSSNAPSDPVSRAFGIEALGSLAAGALLSLWLIGRVDPFSVHLGLFALACLAGVPPARGRIAIGLRLAFSSVAIICIAAGFGARLDRISATARFRSMVPSAKPLRVEQSPYQHLVLAHAAGQYDLFGSGTLLATFPDPYPAARAIHPALCQVEHPRHVLLLGCATAEHIERAQMYGAQVDVLQLDPVAGELIREFEHPQPALAGARILVGDARAFLRNGSPRYDLIFSALPDPTTIMLNRFATVEFFDQAARTLADDGVLVIGVQSGENYLSGDMGAYQGAVFRALQRSFARVLISPEERTTFYATNGSSATDDPQELARRYEQSGVNDPFFDPVMFGELFPAGRIAQHRSALERLAPDRPNTDERPIAPYLSLILWDQYAGGSLAPLLRKLSRARWPTFAFPLALLSAAAALLVLIRGPRKLRVGLTSLSIGSTGLAGMALYVMLISAFQNRFGSLYQQIGLFTAMFMAGLAAGSFIGRRLTRGLRTGNTAPLLLGELAVWAAIALAGLAATDVLGAAIGLSRAWWFGLMALAGAATGLCYPAGTLLLAQDDLRKSASLLEGADHLGACIGGLLGALILIPLAGFAGAAWSLWLFKLPVTLLALYTLILRRTT
ncbi:MAG: hypothetical protein P9M14_09470 [Candidatus Alcyoniella australis]|nr:hypothetical protein [Candidatus Alcyoniella australis]